MGPRSQRTVPHRGATSSWWQSDQRQSSEAENSSLDSSSHRLKGYDDYTYESRGSRHPSQAAHVALDRLRRSLSQNDYETLRPSISHGSNNTKDDLEFTNSNRWPRSWRKSRCKPFDDENHQDSPLTSVSPGLLLYSEDLEQDIENAINELRLNTVTETSQGCTDPRRLPLNVEDGIERYLKGEGRTHELRSEGLPEDFVHQLQTSIEKHRDTVSSRTTDWSNIIPDLGSEYDSDNEQESPPEKWYRNASVPSQLSSTTPAAEVSGAYVSFGGLVKPLVGTMHEEPPSPHYSRYQRLKPLPPLPPGGIANLRYLYRANALPGGSSTRSPASGICHEGPQKTPTSHIASQIRMLSPRKSATFPTGEFSTVRPPPTEPSESSSSSSAAPLDQSQIHPALRNQHKPSRPRYSSKTRESGSSQSSQPTRSYRRQSYAQSDFTESSDSDIRHPSTTVSGLDSPTLSTLSYTQPDIRTTLEPNQLDNPYTRRHSIGGQLDFGGMTSYANTALEIPKLRRQNTDDSEKLILQALLDSRREQVALNIQTNPLFVELEEAERSSEFLQNKSSTQSKTRSFSQRLGLKRLASDARSMYSPRNLRSTPVLLSDSTPAPPGDTAALGSAPRPSRSASQSSGRRYSSVYSRDLSRVVSRENLSTMKEMIEKVGMEGAKRPKGGPLRKVFELQSKFSGHRDKDMLPTSSEKAAKLLGGLPGYAPSVTWNKRVKEAEEILKAVENLI